MLTKIKVMDVLNCPYLYTRKVRLQAAKAAIEMLDKIAENENEQAVEAEVCDCGSKHPPIPYMPFKYFMCPDCRGRR